jgi:DNA-directed RNA polymerase subunit RPC12/RpoP
MKGVVMDNFARNIIIRLSRATPTEQGRIMKDLSVAERIGTIEIEEAVALASAGEAARNVRDEYHYLECPVCGWVDREGGDEYCPCGSKMLIREQF